MDDQTCRTCENCRHRYKCDEELPCLRCGPGLNYWQPNKADLARAEAPPAAEPPAPEAECARGGKMMSKYAPLSRKTVETLRDFAFAYYCEHEGPSESEHKALNLAQALDGDLARAAQAAADPISNCMCGHCQSWADHGGGMGWCSEHNTMTVSGHSCKHARPKAEYAEPAGEAEAPIPEPPAPEKKLRERRRYWTWYDECLRRNQENASLREELEVANERAEQAEARGQATEEKLAGCFPRTGLPPGQLSCVAITLRAIARDGLIPTTVCGKEQAEILQGVADAIERGAEGEGVRPTRDVIRMARRYTPLSGGICLNAKDLGIPAEWLVPSEAGERTEG